MNVQFELNLKITGASLQEVDDGLIQAAGARLQARMVGGGVQALFQQPPPPAQRPPQIQDPVSVAAAQSAPVPAQTAAAPTTEKRKPGRQPGFKPKPKEELTSPTPITKTEPQAIPTSIAQQAKTPPEGTSSGGSSPKTTTIAPSKEACIAALSDVNSKINIDKARECLSRFGVSRVRDLKEEQHQDFINFCNEQIAAGV